MSSEMMTLSQAQLLKREDNFFLFPERETLLPTLGTHSKFIKIYGWNFLLDNVRIHMSLSAPSDNFLNLSFLQQGWREICILNSVQLKLCLFGLALPLVKPQLHE